MKKKILNLQEFSHVSDKINEEREIQEWLDSEDPLAILEGINFNELEEDLSEYESAILRQQAYLASYMLDEDFKKWFDNVASTVIDSGNNILNTVKNTLTTKSRAQGGLLHKISSFMNRGNNFVKSFGFSDTIDRSIGGKIINNWYNFKNKFLFGKYYTLSIDKTYNQIYELTAKIRKNNPYLSFAQIENILFNYHFITKGLMVLQNFKEDNNNMFNQTKKDYGNLLQIKTAILDLSSKISILDKNDKNYLVDFNSYLWLLTKSIEHLETNFKIFEYVLPIYDLCIIAVPEFIDYVNSDRGKKLDNLLEDSKKLRDSIKIDESNYQVWFDYFVKFIDELIDVSESLFMTFESVHQRYSKIFINMSKEEVTGEKEKKEGKFYKDGKFIDLYSILEIEPNATFKEVNLGFKKTSMKWHPDKFVNETPDKQEISHEMMLSIIQARDVLSDPQQRESYDYLYKKNGGKINFKDKGKTIDKKINSKTENLKSSFNKLLDFIKSGFIFTDKNESKIYENAGLENHGVSIVKSVINSKTKTKTHKEDIRSDAFKTILTLIASFPYSPFILALPVVIIKTLYSRYKKVARIKKLLNSRDLSDAERKKLEETLKQSSRAYVKALTDLENFKKNDAEKVKKLTIKYKDEPEKLKKYLDQQKEKKKKMLDKLAKEFKETSIQNKSRTSLQQ